MTDKELKRLKRVDLLELLIAQTRETDRLRAELEELKAKMAERDLVLAQSGSIAEAALKLNEVFEAAQAAADQYVAGVKSGADLEEQTMDEILLDSLEAEPPAQEERGEHEE